MATRTRKRSEFTKDCQMNVHCCRKQNALECAAGDFHPPLLGGPAEFCKEALAKGIPMQRCKFTKPATLVVAAEPSPEETLPTNRYLKNWQKWCRIWKQSNEKLSHVRKGDSNPPLMNCTETKWGRKEDDDLFDRTFHNLYLNGYNVKSTQRPARLKSRPNDGTITETILPRHLRIYPEMKRFRYAKRIRDEMNLSIRCPSPRDMPAEFSEKLKAAQDHKDEEMINRMMLYMPDRPTGRHFDWEKPWRRSKYLEYVQDMDPCEVPNNGYLAPNPEHLILETKPPTKKPDPDNKTKLPPNIHIPELVFTRESLTRLPTLRKSNEEKPAPVMRVIGCRTEILMEYDFSKVRRSYHDQLPYDQEHFIEELDPFCITSRGKDTRRIVLKNEGATAIRYQWLRFPPTKEIAAMLRNPSAVLENGELHTQNTRRPKGNEPEEVHKACNLEFRFRELPGVILTGQKMEIPIIFRAQKPGYYHETLYLLTHPQLSDQNGKGYAVRLTGICMDPDLQANEDNKFRTQNVKESVDVSTLDKGAFEAVNAIIDRAVFKDKEFPGNATLPHGKVTNESIFYAHNKNLTYHYGVSQKGLESIRKVIEFLVPKERILNNTTVCELSIQSLYRLLWNQNASTSLYWSHFKSERAESMLSSLADITKILHEPRRFSYPTKAERITFARKATTVALVHEIVDALANIDTLYAGVGSTVIIKKTKRKTHGPGHGGVAIRDKDEPRKSGEGDAIENSENIGDENLKVVPSASSAWKSSETSKERGSKKRDQSKGKDGRRKTKKIDIAHKEKHGTESEADEEEWHSASEDEALTDVEDYKMRPGGERKSTNATKIQSTIEIAAKPSVLLNNLPGVSQNRFINTLSPNSVTATIGGNSSYLEDARKNKIAQAKRIVLRDILGSAIDRIACMVDAMKAADDYRPSKFMVSPDANCCKK